ncbi:hypothetical protein NB710_000501 [Xanthomonas sacchari]|nr:hypothetical protein [Xanthomonas sacchari]
MCIGKRALRIGECGYRRFRPVWFEAREVVQIQIELAADILDVVHPDLYRSFAGAQLKVTNALLALVTAAKELLH